MPFKKQSLKINVRITEDARHVLDDIEKQTHQKDTYILQHLVEMLAQHWQQHHEITFPIHIATGVEITKATGTIEHRTTKKSQP